MPNKYVTKAEREREVQIKKSVQTLLALCDDSTASPETRLGAVKLLRPIQQVQEQLFVKDEQISQKGDEAHELKRQLGTKREELEAAAKRLKAALEDIGKHEKEIEVLTTNNKNLAHELTGRDKQLNTTEKEKTAALDRATTPKLLLKNS